MQLRDHEGVKGKRDAYPFDPRLLKVDSAYNVRDMTSPEAIERLGELKESIRSNGVRVPLEVRFDGSDVFIVAGHRRHKAVMELIDEGTEIETVLIIHEAKGTNDAERTLNLVVSNTGEPLKPLEVAEVVRRLCNYGWTEAQIMTRLGWRSTASVKQHLDMLAMPAAVQRQVRDGDVSASTALHVVKETRDARTDPAFAAELIANAAEEKRRLGKKGRATPKEVRKALDKVRVPKTPPVDAAPVAHMNGDASASKLLFAAAAEIYKHAKSLLNGIDTGLVLVDTDADETMANTMRGLRAAIAKAEGRAP